MTAPRKQPLYEVIELPEFQWYRDVACFWAVWNHSTGRINGCSRVASRETAERQCAKLNANRRARLHRQRDGAGRYAPELLV